MLARTHILFGMMKNHNNRDRCKLLELQSRLLLEIDFQNMNASFLAKKKKGTDASFVQLSCSMYAAGNKY